MGDASDSNIPIFEFHNSLRFFVIFIGTLCSSSWTWCDSLFQSNLFCLLIKKRREGGRGQVCDLTILERQFRENWIWSIQAQKGTDNVQAKMTWTGQWHNLLQSKSTKQSVNQGLHCTTFYCSTQAAIIQILKNKGLARSWRMM